MTDNPNNFKKNTEELFKKYSNIIDYSISKIKHNIHNFNAYSLSGKVISAKGNNITASLPNARIGDLCHIVDNTNLNVKAEVVAIQSNQVILIPFAHINNISQHCFVLRQNQGFLISISDRILGTIVDGLGEHIDNMVDKELGSQNNEQGNSYYNISGITPDPLKRPLIDKQLFTGITAIDLFTPCGIGQRMGIFAPPGVGKTTLLGMLLRGANADVVVITLIGERGREVREFIELELDEELRKKCVLVVATSDKPPVEQVKSAYVAQTIAEYFRDQGKNVVLFMDSITRFARAMREIGLSAGEPITRGGFPPSVFLAFPQLMERAGNTETGSITAFYMVLTDIETNNSDPIAEEVKSIIDGHIMLSRNLANQGHYPAIDVLSSLSRIEDRIITTKHHLAASRIKMLLEEYREIEFLVKVGEYKEGQNKVSDEAIKKQPQIMELLKQRKNIEEEHRNSNSHSNNFNKKLNSLYQLAEGK
jgi:type III secretion protein N (ATPase)